MTINRETFLEEWIEDLRFGEWEQTETVLGVPGTKQRCCLGVACEVYKRLGGDVVHGDGDDGHVEAIVYTVDKSSPEVSSMPHPIADLLGVKDQDVPVMIDGFGIAYITDLNDSGQWTFDDLADLIERDPFYSGICATTIRVPDPYEALCTGDEE